MKLWSVTPGSWKGETCFIIGGGPSLPVDLVPYLGSQGRVIAVNNAYKLAPLADITYSADYDWFLWHRRNLHSYIGPLLLMRADLPPLTGCKRVVRRIMHIGGPRLSRDPARIAGWCSGSNALNIAYLAGAERIILLGFDMRPGHWHDEHKKETPPHRYQDRYIPHFEAMADELKNEPVTVLNASPGSAMTCFPIVDPRDVIQTAEAAVAV